MGHGRCKVCGKPLRDSGSICEKCVVKLYFEALVGGKSIKELAKSYGVSRRTLSYKLNVIRERGVLLDYLKEDLLSSIVNSTGYIELEELGFVFLRVSMLRFRDMLVKKGRGV